MTMRIKSYLTIYDEGVLDVPGSPKTQNTPKKYISSGDQKQRREKKRREKMLRLKEVGISMIGNEFIKIQNFSNYLISDRGVVISTKTNKVKRLKPVKKTDTCSYVTMIDDNNLRHKIYVEKLVRKIFKK